MKPHIDLSPRSFPAHVADLGFSALLPTDWISHDVAETNVDFDDPTRFTPLAVLTAPQAAIALAFAARPAYEDGTVDDWAWYILNHNQLKPRSFARLTVAGVGAVAGEAVQPSDLGPMVVRFAFCEDGGRLLNFTLTAPELFADSVLEVWYAMLKSFTLETPRGSRFEALRQATPTADAIDTEAEATEDPGHAEAAEALAADDAIANARRASFDNRPAWWYEALAFEAKGELDAAEVHIKMSCPHIGFAHATASLYRDRMCRLMATGDQKGALAAFLKSSDFIHSYAGFASSGGEGAALSLERDEFLDQLVAAYGSNPEAEAAPAIGVRQ